MTICVVDRNRPPGNPVGQSLPFDKFQYEVSRAGGLLDIVDPGNVGVVQCSQDLGFSLKARHAIGIAGEFFRQDLDRYVALQLGITRAINLSHAAFSKQGSDLVRPELASDFKLQ